jgi:hypothetical protein
MPGVVPGIHVLAALEQDGRDKPGHDESSSALRDLIEKAGDAPDTSIPDDREIRALDRAVDAVGAQSGGH